MEAMDMSELTGAGPWESKTGRGDRTTTEQEAREWRRGWRPAKWWRGHSSSGR